MIRRKFWKPAVVLFFLAPAIGELVSGSAPPAEFFNPFTLTLLAILYGGGAILARELTHRWGKGWPTLLTLGAAYGIIEEGLMVKSFFDPNWMDLDILGVYGRTLGVNWVWAAELTIYHAVISITIPVMLVELLFPDWRDRPWVSPKAFRRLAWLFGLNGVFIFVALTPYRPPFLPYVTAVLVVIWLYRRAKRLPHPRYELPERPSANIWRFFGLGFLGTFSLFFISWVLPNLNFPVPVTLVLLVGLPFWVRWRLLKLIGQDADWPFRQQWALAAGALSFFILLAPILEADNANRPDNTGGMVLIAILLSLFLFWIRRRINRWARPSDSENLAVEAA
ncbi:MAG: hypothetical protein ACE5FD_07355 [Anaerolineae bacterium]